MNRLSLSILFIALYSSTLFGYKITSGSISFYSERLNIEYNTDLFRSKNIEINEQSILSYYKLLEYSDYRILLENIQKISAQLKLNDWLHFELLNTAVAEFASDLPALNRSLITWFLASKSGWNTRLAYTKEEVYIYLQSDDEVFEVPMIEDNGKVFINASHIIRNHRNRVKRKAIYLLNFKPNPNGRSFQFRLQKLPQLHERLQKKKVHFRYGTQAYEITIEVDNNIKRLLRDYPLVAESSYITVGLSPTLKRTLLPKVKQLIADKTIAEGLQFIAAFTRTAFEYKEDNDYFGMSKPMIADELFQYAYSDCEDRSALFYNLVKEIYNLPMLIVTFPDHLTIAVAFDCPEGDAIRYHGKKYYICDPTGPINSIRIGNVPKEYQNQKMTIMELPGK